VSLTGTHTGPRLINLSIAEFAAAVASAAEPVPAGASVAALSGANSAALLELVCSVRELHQPGLVAAQQNQAYALRQRLLELVDADAAAFRAFLATETGSPARQQAATAVAEVPLEIGRACHAVAQLARGLEPDIRGATRLDLGAATHTADAAMQSALDIAEYNLRLIADAAAREAFEAEISQLRGGPSRGSLR
jgi:formiminotetrahydrofolate cyclodeaminase